LQNSIDDSQVVANDVNDTIVLFDCSNNVIVNNIADDNGSGITLESIGFGGSSNNEIHANTTNNNRFYGIFIQSGSTGNSVTGNYSFANSVFDMADQNGNCDANKWRGNHFGTADPSCIQSGEDEDRKDDDRKGDDRKDDN